MFKKIGSLKNLGILNPKNKRSLDGLSSLRPEKNINKTETEKPTLPKNEKMKK